MASKETDKQFQKFRTRIKEFPDQVSQDIMFIWVGNSSLLTNNQDISVSVPCIKSWSIRQYLNHPSSHIVATSATYCLIYTVNKGSDIMCECLQVVRYDRGREPLWVSSENKPMEVPPCPHCGEPRQFEFQVRSNESRSHHYFHPEHG